MTASAGAVLDRPRVLGWAALALIVLAAWVAMLSLHGRVGTEADWLAARVADKSPTAIRRGKHALGAISGMSAAQALDFMEAQVGLLPLTDDAKEGMAAFAEKRAPKWSGT